MTDAAIHIQTTGQGPDLVMLHGWAMHSGYFDPVIDMLSEDFRVHQVDIPGHGKSRSYPEDYSIENVGKEILNAVSPILKGRAIWLGWSLGGSVATWIAAHDNKKIEGLILVASNPRFVQQVDWPYGISDDVLQEFADSLIRDYEKTLLRFLSLQIRGVENERELLRQLRTQMRACDAPVAAVLNGGLKILREFDGRALLQKIKQPILIIAGKKDTLVPVTALGNIDIQTGNTTLLVWDAAGHAPFISNPEKFSREVKAFVNDNLA